MASHRPAPFEWLDHTADIGIIVTGRSPEEVYERAVLATGALIAGDAPVRAVSERTFEVSGDDRVERLVALLGEVIYVYDVERFLPASVEVSEGEDGVRARVEGEEFDPARHWIEREVKAATYHAATFEPAATGWEARVVFDL